MYRHKGQEILNCHSLTLACLLSAGAVAVAGCGGGSSSSGGDGNGSGNGDTGVGDVSIDIELVSANEAGDSATGSQSVGANHASLSDAGAAGAMNAAGTLVAFNGGGVDYNADYSYEGFVRDMTEEDLGVEHVSLYPEDQPHDGFSGYSLRPALSGDGSTVAFYSSGFSSVDSIRSQIFVRNLEDQETAVASVVEGTGAAGAAGSRFPNLSDDGSLVVFESDADLIDGGTHDDEAGFPFPTQQIYLRDMVAQETIRVSRDADSPDEPGDGRSQMADISGNGDYVVFESRADNLVEDVSGDDMSIFLYDVKQEELTHLSVDAAGDALTGDARRPAISDSGDRVVFTGPGSMYLWERGEGTDLVLEESVTDPAISGDGRYVAYQDTSGGNGQIYRFDLDSRDEPVRITHAHDGSSPDADSEHPVISEDGSIIAFDSAAENLLGGAHDHGTGTDAYRAVITQE